MDHAWNQVNHTSPFNLLCLYYYTLKLMLKLDSFLL